jgi:hypothetical protein
MIGMTRSMIRFIIVHQATPNSAATRDTAASCCRPAHRPRLGPARSDTPATVIESYYPAGMSLDVVARYPVALVEFPADDPEQALRFWVGVLGVDLQEREASEGAKPNSECIAAARGPGTVSRCPTFPCPTCRWHYGEWRSWAARSFIRDRRGRSAVTQRGTPSPSWRLSNGCGLSSSCGLLAADSMSGSGFCRR